MEWKIPERNSHIYRKRTNREGLPLVQERPGCDDEDRYGVFPCA